jgi:hypothetical protein
MSPMLTAMGVYDLLRRFELVLVSSLALGACGGGGGGADGEGARNVGSNGFLATDKSVYGPSEPIRVTFTDAPGDNGLDWIAIYKGGETPHYGSLAFRYIGGTGEPGAAPASATVVVTGEGSGRVSWPFPAGEYAAWYLLDDGYTSLGSVNFTTTCPDSAPGCSTAHFGGGPSSGGCTADVDCGSCQRCERSTGSCIARLSC